MYRSPPLEIRELMALYGRESNIHPIRDEDCTSEVRRLGCYTLRSGLGVQKLYLKLPVKHVKSTKYLQHSVYHVH